MAKNTEQRPSLIDSQTLHKNRPLSPHLSIYKLQLTSGLSILHRITGAYLYIGLAIFTWVIFALVYSPNILEEWGSCIYGNFYTAILFKLMLLGWTFSLFYHQLNGIRHLFWDIGKGFDLKNTYRSGRIVLSLSILLTIACWILVYWFPSPVESVVVEPVLVESE
jgi:succinate dehydrogenase / fumarate reductase cytochrome b subunit